MKSSTVLISHILYMNVFFIILDHTTANHLHVISREEWGALPPRLQPDRLFTKSVSYVIITQTNSMQCDSPRECTELVRQKQLVDTNQFGKNDIDHNFIIGGDGNVYEARGWHVQSEEERSYDLKSIYINFVGDYSFTAPTGRQITAAFELLKKGTKKKYLHKNYKVLTLRQITHRTLPGIHLYNNVKTWKHWVPIP